jgi:large subunit ribosomal protein L17
MRHLKAGRKLKRTSSHRKALLRNLATSLFEHKRIVTTEAKAKELRPYAEQLITKAKKALFREKNNMLTEGQTIDIHYRRIVGRDIRNKAVLQELFDTIAPVVEERQGGYCRIVKKGFRRGDGGTSAIIELVDFANPQDGYSSIKDRKKAMEAKAKRATAKKNKKAKEDAAKAEKPVTENVVEEVTPTPAVEEKPKAKKAAPKKEVAPEPEVKEETLEAGEENKEEE